MIGVLFHSDECQCMMEGDEWGLLSVTCMGSKDLGSFFGSTDDLLLNSWIIDVIQRDSGSNMNALIHDGSSQRLS